MADVRPLFLDAHSTTPLDPRVLDAMMPWLTERFANPASTTHTLGLEAAEAVAEARARLAVALDCEPDDIVFTSGATEANNLALKGVAMSARGSVRIVTAATEHPSVLDPLKRLARGGVDVEILPVDSGGLIDPAALERALAKPATLVSIMHANNESGVVQDIASLAAIATHAGVAFHTDATQSVGKIPIAMDAMGITMLSLSGHKMYGPRGIGALIVRRKPVRVTLTAQIDGGGHQFGMRSGTLNVSAIVGLARAVEIALEEMKSESTRLAAMRDRLRARLFDALPEIIENGNPAHKLPHSLNVAIRYVDSMALLNAVPELALSTGSACSSAEPEPSHVLLAMGRDEEHARCSIRVGLHRFVRETDVDRAAELIVGAARALRAHSPLAP